MNSAWSPSTDRLRRIPRSLLLHARVAGLLLCLPVLLRWKTVQQAVLLLTPRSTCKPQPWREVERVNWAVDRLYQRPLLRSYGPCLRRSLTLYYFLRRQGYPVRVALGAYLQDGALIAHAWLTLHGKPFLEPASVARFAAMAEWGGAGDGDTNQDGAPISTSS
jgi:hypothetical protein